MTCSSCGFSLPDGAAFCPECGVRQPERPAPQQVKATAAQPDVSEQIMGPAVGIAFKDGQPTPAAHAFARKTGVDISKLARVTTAKGEYLAAKVTKKGRGAKRKLGQLRKPA